VAPRTIHDGNGNPLDAKFEVQRTGAALSVVIEARGGTKGTSAARNTDYGPGLTLLLERLRDRGARISDAIVDSKATEHLPPAARRLTIAGYSYPMTVDDPVELQLRLGAAQARVGRERGAKGSGNRTKRLRISLVFDGLAPTPEELQVLLANPMATDKSAAARAGERPSLARLVLRCTADVTQPWGRRAELVVDGRTVIEFEETPPKKSRPAPMNRTAGVFASTQAPTLQAFTLLLWLADLRERGVERGELRFAQVKRLRYWDNVASERAFEQRLRAMLRDSRAIEQLGRRAWIRREIDVKIDGSETQRGEILRWAGLQHEVSAVERAVRSQPELLLRQHAHEMTAIPFDTTIEHSTVAAVAVGTSPQAHGTVNMHGVTVQAETVVFAGTTTPSASTIQPSSPASFLRPTPSYPDVQTQVLSEKLDAAKLRRLRLRERGRNTTEEDCEILALKRQLREGGQLRAGDSLGDGDRYELLDLLGRGGFASVWLAYDNHRRSNVAIKVLHGNLSGDRTRLDRFSRGARIMNNLHHEAIARVLEPYGENGGWHYFVMEHLPGGDLRRAVLESRLKQEDILPLIRWEIPRLCRGGIRGLTFPGFSRRNPLREPHKLHERDPRWMITRASTIRNGSASITSCSSQNAGGECSTVSCAAISVRSSERLRSRKRAGSKRVISCRTTCTS
jgi:hypothetical protein